MPAMLLSFLVIILFSHVCMLFAFFCRVIGAIEISSGLRHPGVHVAVSQCRLHHLPFEKIDEIEKENPLLVLRLYKMLSRLMSRRQEITIDQLATMKSIMSSPAHSKPISRAALRAFS
jgi:CRP-like cAMP-binding protein